MTFSHRLYPVILLLAVAAAHASGVGGSFQFDDFNVIVNNPVVHSWSGWWADLPRGIRPFLKLTYTLNWTSGFGAAGFHLLNLLIHCGNTILVYVVARRFIRMAASEDEGLSAAAAFGAALLFAVHPVQTESVTYICGRSTSLMSLLYLGSFYLYVDGVERGRRTSHALLSPLLFLLALLTKETAVTLPAALLLWEFLRPGEDFRRALGRQAGHWLLLGAVMAAFLLHPNYGGLFFYSIGTRTLAENLLGQVNGIWYLITRLVLVNRLSIDPELPQVVALTLPVAVRGVALLLFLLAGALLVRRRPVAGFGILWFFLHLLPTNSVLPRLDIANERQLYLASFGLFLPLSLLLVHLGKLPRRRLPAALAAGLVVLLLVSASVRRNGVYRSEISLWRDTALKSPGKARVWNNLGYAYFVAGRLGEARDAYREALRLDPGFTRARRNLETTEAALRREVVLRWMTGGLPAAAGRSEGGGEP